MEWLGLLQRHKRLVVEASRDHAKSFTFSYSWPLFNIQRAKEPENIALISYSEDQAKKNLLNIRKAIESKESLKWLMPASRSHVWESSMLNMSNDCTVEAFGFGSSVRGGHYHKIIVDDPTKDHMTMSLSEQENFFFGVILPALRKGGQIVVCGNPVAKQDFLSVLEGNSEFISKLYPAWNEKKEPLWPEQYQISDLEERQRQMPAHIFAREYLLKRVSAEDSKFKEAWIKYYQDEQLPKTLFKIMTIDPAISPGGDALAAVVTGTDSRENVYILDRLNFHGNFKNGIGELCDMMIRNLPDYIGFEEFAFQKMYKFWLEEEIKRRDLPFYIQSVGKDSKKTKAMRIESLQPKLAQGKMFFKAEHAPLINQLLLWDPLSKSNEDDEIDALAWQVGKWRRPYTDEQIQDSQEARPGSMGAEIEDILSARDSFISHLFSEMRS